MTTDVSATRQRLWRVYAALKVTLQRLQRSEPMVQGSFFLQQRRCGKPNCRCAQGQLHGAWVITRSESGRGRTYLVPAPERGRLRQWTAEYRRYQRARAVLVHRHVELLRLVDELAEARLIPWPQKPTGGPSP